MNEPLDNLFERIPDRLDGEQSIDLLARPGLWIERIVSIGHATPPGQWLEQDQSEWVLLLQGEATLRLEDVPEAHLLLPGDHLHIPAGVRHRVERTTAGKPTVWLAVHYGKD